MRKLIATVLVAVKIAGRDLISRPVTSATIGCFLIVLLCCTTGCGTIFQGTKQRISLTSDPAGAEIYDKGMRLSGTTPAEVEMLRGESHKLCFKKQGYKPVTVPMIRRSLFKWWVLDAFTLGVGNGIDASTGALFEIHPKSVHVILEPVEPAGPVIQ